MSRQRAIGIGALMVLVSAAVAFAIWIHCSTFSDLRPPRGYRAIHVNDVIMVQIKKRGTRHSSSHESMTYWTAVVVTRIERNGDLYFTRPGLTHFRRSETSA